jgi:hypothetical protein
VDGVSEATVTNTVYRIYFLCYSKVVIVQCVPLATEPGISLIILTPMKI